MAAGRKQYQDQELKGLVKNLSSKVKAYRMEANLSQNQLAKAAKVALSTLNEIENQVLNDVRLSTVTAIARSLGRKPIELLTDSDLTISDPDRSDLKRAAQLLMKVVRKLDL